MTTPVVSATDPVINPLKTLARKYLATTPLPATFTDQFTVVPEPVAVLPVMGVAKAYCVMPVCAVPAFMRTALVLDHDDVDPAGTGAVTVALGAPPLKAPSTPVERPGSLTP